LRRPLFNGKEKTGLWKNDGKELTFTEEKYLTHSKSQRQKNLGMNESEKNLFLNSNHSAHPKYTFGQEDATILVFTLLKCIKKLN
jgi:hypothetical protein